MVKATTSARRARWTALDRVETRSRLFVRVDMDAKKTRSFATSHLASHHHHPRPCPTHALSPPPSSAIPVCAPLLLLASALPVYCALLHRARASRLVAPTIIRRVHEHLPYIRTFSYLPSSSLVLTTREHAPPGVIGASSAGCRLEPFYRILASRGGPSVESSRSKQQILAHDFLQPGGLGEKLQNRLKGMLLPLLLLSWICRPS